MREIKFRAWCQGTHNNMTFSNAHMEYDVTIVDGKYASVESGWDIHGTYPTVPLMQYTGLKDKNGKEIYEGDVVKILFGEWASKSPDDPRTLEEYLDSKTKKYEVVFTQGEFLGKRNTGSYNPWSTDYEGNTYAKLIAEKHGFVEVIGNIFQDSHLLND